MSKRNLLQQKSSFINIPLPYLHNRKSKNPRYILDIITLKYLRLFV